MEGECHRHFYSASYSEIHDPCTSVVLCEPNVSSVTFVSDDYDAALQVAYSGSDPVARVEVTDTGVTVTSKAGTATTATHTFANETTMAAMAAAISGESGWTATVLLTATTIASDTLVRSGSRDAKDVNVQLDHWADYGGEYMTEYPEGIIGLYTMPMGRTRIDYVAGWDDSSLPEELELVLFELTKTVIDRAAKDAGVSSEKLGEYSYNLADASRNLVIGRVDWTDSQKGVLKRYTRVMP